MRAVSTRHALQASVLCSLLGLSAIASAQDAKTETKTMPTPAEAAETTASSPATASPATAAMPAGDAASPATINGKIGAPEAGKGQIVFFREKKFAGGGVRYKVREGSTELGKLSSGTYFVEAVEPGTHEYTVHSEAKDVLTLEVEAGETYFVQGAVTMGVFAGHPNLSPSDQSVFDAMSAKLKLVE